jgi:dTDP-4-dehydrorhamnose 3,5-epimerase
MNGPVFREQTNEYAITWDDPDLTIPWPVLNPMLSDKDREYPKLRDLSPDQLPVFGKRI